MNKFKELREQKKLSQNKLAKELSINVMTYNGWENSKTEPNIKNLTMLADFYSVSLDYLVGRSFGNDLGFLSKEQFENFKKIMQLSETDQAKIFGYAASFFENNKNN